MRSEDASLERRELRQRREKRWRAQGWVPVQEWASLFHAGRIYDVYRLVRRGRIQPVKKVQGAGHFKASQIWIHKEAVIDGYQPLAAD